MFSGIVEEMATLVALKKDKENVDFTLTCSFTGELKIDQSFVRDMLTDDDDRGIVQAVVQLAGVFNRQVIAEGVETKAHGAALLALGCHRAQGYGIARPMPAPQFEGWMARWQAERPWQQIAQAAQHRLPGEKVVSE